MKKRIILAGGSGFLGRSLAAHLSQSGYEVVILSRSSSGDGPARYAAWDGKTLGAWAKLIDGADAVINLAGRSVNCRYNRANLKEMMDSRVDSTRVMGLAIAQAKSPPRVWLQMSTATIYAHRFDAPNDESGPMGGDEPGVPSYWKQSIEIAKAWERTQQEAVTPKTRRVALRTAMVMGPARGGVFDVLLSLTRLRLGGAIAGGHQYVSWIHEADFVRAIEFLLNRDDLQGPVNLAAPNPLPQREFMAALRCAWGVRLGLPASKWMLEIGAIFMRTESELVLKSRRVVPGRLLGAGFSFEFPKWPEAASELVARWRNNR